MSEIQKKEFTKSELMIQDEAIKLLLLYYDKDWRIGDIFYDNYYRGGSKHGYCTLVDVTFKDENFDPKYAKENILLTFYAKGYAIHSSYDEYCTKDLSDVISRDSIYWVSRNTSVEDYEKEVEALANAQITPQQLLDKYFPQEQASADSTSLMTMNKDVLLDKKRQLAEQQQFLTARATQARELLEQRRRQLNEIATTMNKFIGKLTRLIWSIELYLGVKEELVQFGQGQNAPAEDPICFRQRLMYMDVEVGDPTDDLKGIDFSNIDKFDAWLMKMNPYWKKYNYEIMLPESKGIVIFRVRENQKHYSDNPWINAMMNVDNNKTYVLIRNGENIYRIWADINMGRKIFPNQNELEDLVSLMNGVDLRKERGEYTYDSSRTAENADKELERYKLNMILYQGIIERTPCFPDNSELNIFAREGYGEAIKYIYDADNSRQLPTNVLVFKDWLKNINSRITEGSRILWIDKLFNKNSRYYSENKADRFFKMNYTSQVPDSPNTGLYEVYSQQLLRPIQKYTRTKDSTYHDNEKSLEGVTYSQSKSEDCWDVVIPAYYYPQLFIKFNPGGSVNYGWNYWQKDDTTRKNKLSWAIHKEDNCLVNWDSINRKELKELEFYLYTRIGRENYLDYMPILTEIYKEKTNEMKQEDDFIKYALFQAGLNPIDDFEKGIEAMEWWKNKNKWKRALTMDDAKALRMIIPKLKKEKS